MIRTVDDLSVVADEGLDKTPGFEFLDSDAGKGAVHTETINQNGLGDQLVCGNFLEKTFVGRLVQDNHVVSLVLDLLGGPFLQQGEVCVRNNAE